MRRPFLTPCLALLSVGALSLSCAEIGRAQPAHPPFMPTRDVRVSYQVKPDAAPSPQRITVSFVGGGGLMRIDAPGGQGATILDRDRRLMTVVINSARVYMELPERDELRSPFLLDPSMHFSAGAADRVAGLACRDWTITGTSGNSVACVTADGVVLSDSGADSQGARGHLVAEQVSYGPLDASLFRAPSDYSRVAHPEGPGPYARGSADPTTGGPAPVAPLGGPTSP